MKITKSQLKQIIKEELTAALSEEGRSPRSLGLPHNVGQPEALLVGIKALLSGEGDMPEENAQPIINLIDKKLQQNPGEETGDGLRGAKKQIMDKFPVLFSRYKKAQRRRAGHEEKPYFG